MHILLYCGLATLLGASTTPTKLTPLAGTPPPAGTIQAPDWTPTTDFDQELGRDPKFLFATLFPNAHGVDFLRLKLTPKDRQAFDASQATAPILTRIIVAMAWGGLYYTPAQNGHTSLKPWPWSLATALAHGQRAIFEFRGKANADAEYGLFLTGVTRAVVPDPYPRLAASHGCDFDKGEVLETKLKGVVGSAHAVIKGMGGHHHGINLAFGGLGNVRKDLQYVGPWGFATDATTFRVSTTAQHGHLFLHTDDGAGAAVIEVGIESSAPGCTNMYGESHNIKSASKDATKSLSVDGGQKMAGLLGTTGPNELGGKWVKFKDPQACATLEQVIAKVDAMNLKTRKALLWDLLTLDALGAQARLRQAVS